MCSNMLKEIESVKKFVAGRLALVGSVDAALLENFSKALVVLINTAPVFGPGEASSIEDALKDSPYGDNTSKIVAAIDSRIKAAGAAADAKPSPRAVKSSGAGKQLLKNWWFFCTEADWAVFNDPKRSWHSKMTTGVERAMSLGLWDFHEQTLKWLLAMLLLCHYTDGIPAYKQIYEKLQDLKKCVAAERRICDHEQLIEFPDTPEELPPSIWRSAYADGKPVRIQLTGVSTIADHIPLRGNSKLLKEKNASPQLDSSVFVKPEPNSPRADPAAHDQAPAARCSLSRPKTEEGHTANVPQDHDERALWEEYQRKISRLRSEKAASYGDASPAPSPVPCDRPAARTIALRRGPDGKMQLMPRSSGRDATDGVKDEDDEPEVDTAPKPEGAVTTLEDLDPYSRAAVAALSKRKATKEAAKAAEKQAAKDAKAKLKAEAGAGAAGGAAVPAPKKRGRPPSATKSESAAVCLKRPASAASKGPSPKAVKKDPAKACAVKTEHPKAVRMKKEEPEVPKSAIMKSMPKFPADGSNPPPVRYNGGVIYTSLAVRRFRALRKRGDKYSELGASFATSSKKEAWETVVKGIDKYKK